MQANREHNQTAELKAADAQHHLHPFTNHAELRGDDNVRVVSSAKGTWLTDTDGNAMLDGMAGLWNVNIGYGRDELAEVAFEQMKQLPYYNAFFKTTMPPTIRLAEKLAEITPDGINQFMFGSSGSESNDTVLRMVRYFWQVQGKPEKRAIISRNSAYHGSTLAASQLGGMGIMHEQGNRVDDIHHVMPPNYFSLAEEGETEEAFMMRAAEAVENKILEVGPDKVAGFIGEPIQGAGGLIFPTKAYWRYIQDICKRYDILLMVDEVICGFGRLGTWFGSQFYDIKPDIITMAKGITSGYIPLSAVGLGERMGKVFAEHDAEFVHGYTYAGHPVACAVALKNIELMQEERIVENVDAEIGPYLQAKLYDTLYDHPLVGEVRGHGMLAAVELVGNKLTNERYSSEKNAGMVTRDRCFANNLVMRAVGDTMILSPVLTISREEVDELCKRAKLAFDEAKAELG